MEITRKLATIRKVANIIPIENADNIVSVVIDGWNVVTQKSNNFQVEDLVVYFEIDSFLPVTERFEFLRPSSFKVMGNIEGFRVRTIRLRKTISQGLIMPITEFPELVNVAEGDDLTEMLGILKWEPPIYSSLSGISKGNFPSLIPKTDQDRIQNIYKYFYNWDKNIKYEATIKLDGASMTVYFTDNNYGVCSRNLDLVETESNTYWKTARQNNIIDALEKLNQILEHESLHVAIQGELMGEGIQGNRESIKGHKFFVFDVFKIKDGRYMDAQERKSFIECLKCFGADIDHVPVIEYTTLDKFKSLDDYIEYADRISLKNSIAEGVVFKSIPDNDYDQIRSFKVINNTFLLKEK